MDHHLNIVEFYHDLIDAGDQIRLVGDQLQYRPHQGQGRSETIAALRQHKDALLAWLRERAVAETAYPLSQGQLGMWFDWQCHLETPIHTLLFVARLHEHVQVERLRQAAQMLVDRHPALRTVYALTTEGPQQQVQTRQSVDFVLVDGTTWTDAAVQTWIEIESDRPFDLATGPLMRMRLLQRVSQQQGEQPHYLLHWSFHHIATDLFTIEILQEELHHCYRALVTGEQPRLATAVLTQRDFVRWEEEMLCSNQERLAAFWRNQLGDEPVLLNLPVTSLAGELGQRKARCQILDFTFDPQLAQQLRAYARTNRTTLYTLLLAAYQVLISRYTGRDHFFISSPTTLRDLAGWRNTVGYFVNVILLRADLQSEADDELTFATLLRRTQATITAAMTHHLYPYHAMLHQWHKQIAPDQLRKGLVGFLFEPMHRSIGESDLFAEVLAQGEPNLPEPLSLLIFERPEQLTGRITYQVNHFDPAFIKQMAAHFIVLLEGIVTQPELPVLRLPMLTKAEYHQITQSWNDTRVDLGPPQTIHALFEQQVARTPDAVAVVMDAGYRVQDANLLTYAELNTRANQLAHHLLELGVKSDTLVAVAMERSIEMVVSLLAVLKAGGAYMPIDPTYPTERIRFMLADSAAPILLTQSHLLLAQWAIDTDAQSHVAQQRLVIAVDTMTAQLAGQPTLNPQTQTFAEDLAYVIYTSGSTGSPKGVMVEQRNVVNAFYAWRAAYGLEECRSHLQMASFSFDVFCGDWTRALCSGGKLVLCPHDWLLMPDQLYCLMQRQAVDCAEFVPVVLRQLVRYLQESKQNLHFMRCLIAGSDSWYVNEYRELQALCGPQTRLINSYGVSEATIDSSYFEGDLAQLDEHQLTPIGRPFANTQFYILDAQRQPVPVGVAGELYIGGAGVTRGYHNRPNLTAERFVENPFAKYQLQSTNYEGDGKALPQLLYRTGDRARYLYDGNVEFLGRIDQQVKIRGFRIELGEIENALLTQDGVQEAVVVAQEDGNLPGAGTKRLVAYIVGNAAHEELRQHLAQRLPDYMIPAAFVTLSAMPLTPNGKIDRLALPAPTLERDTASIRHPRTLLEQKIAQVWEQILNVHPIGIHDNFFAIGGHSLLAVQLLAKLQLLLQQPLPLRTLFAAPTVAQLAALVTQNGNAHLSTEATTSVIVLQARGAKSPLTCLPGVGVGPLYLYGLAQSLGPERVIYTLEPVGMDGKTPPLTTVEAIAAHHIAHLQRQQPAGPYHLAGHSFGGLVAYEMAQQLYKAGATVGAVLLLDTRAPSGQVMPVSEVDIMLFYERLVCAEYSLSPTLTAARLQPLTTEERLLCLQQALEAAKLYAPNSPPEQLRDIMHRVVADVQAASTYLPTDFVRLPLHLFVAKEAERTAAATHAMREGWTRYGEVTVHETPGTHTTMMAAPHVQVLAAQLQACLQATERIIA